MLSDGIEDPHNLGAVMRSALLCGAHGIVIPKRGGASVTPTVIKSSAGAAERLPVARVANIGETIRRLKEQGVFVYCADMDGVSLRRNNLTGPIALVLGSEGSGVSQLVKKLWTAWCGWIWLHRAPVWTATTCRWRQALSCTLSPNAQHSRHDPAFGPEPQFELQEGQIPKDKNNGREIAPDEKFRSFFSTAVDIPGDDPERRKPAEKSRRNGLACLAVVRKSRRLTKLQQSGRRKCPPVRCGWVRMRSRNRKRIWN